MKLRPCGSPGTRPHGVALVTVLVLLIVVTLLSLASLRGTLLEERMSANLFDRSLAFQAAESALRVAEQKVREAVLAGKVIGVDCAAPGAICPGSPANVNAVTTDECTANATGCWIGVTHPSSYSALAAGAPQYYIEYMGEFSLSAEDSGSAHAASANQYGSAPSTPRASIYRISARSHNPRINRAFVVLQATVELR